MKTVLILFVSLVLSIQAAYPQAKYPCDSIPRMLRNGADAVVRSSETKSNIINENKALIDHKIAITILNENAEDLVYISLPYDKFNKYSKIKASAYDENGRLIWVLNKFEVYDIKGNSGPAYLDDSRFKMFRFPVFNYPYTIEYSFRLTSETLVLNPVTYIQGGPSIAVEKSGYQYIIPNGIPFRYSQVNMRSGTDSLRSGNKLILTWQEENVAAKRQKVFAPEFLKTIPTLYTTTERFNLKGYTGEMSSWKSFGMWFNKINEGRDVLSKNFADQVPPLIKNATTRKEKINILYKYMQSKTRYFYVAFGIGGVQPIPADQVAKNGYGDCKALSNYMKALLKVAGIESYYTLANVGWGENIKADFPSDQFNHVILCVPDEKDTIWLECTSQTAPLGYLGSSTAGHYALVVTPDGGKLQRTPVLGKMENIFNTTSEISLSGSGDADIRIKAYETGLFYERLKGASESLEDVRKNEIAELLDYPTFSLKKEEYTFGKTKIPFGIAKFEVHIRDLASRGTNRLFVSPSLILKNRYMWKDPTKIELAESYQQNDTVRILIPSGYKIEYLPGDLKVDTRFGKYASHVSGDAKYIYFTRNLEFNKATYPKETYPEFYQFINQIAENDHKMLILKAVNN